MPTVESFYETSSGVAYLGDSREVLRSLPHAVNFVFTSPPYALHFKKAYGDVSKADYVEWFLTFAREVRRVLADDGSFVLNIGGSWNPGSPTRSLYHFKLMIALVEDFGFHLAQECYWYNPAKMPVPAEWVTVRRVRVKDSVEHVWWLSKTPFPKADNRKVLALQPRHAASRQRGVKATVRPSGHNITSSFDKIIRVARFRRTSSRIEVATDMLIAGNNSANDTLHHALQGVGRQDSSRALPGRPSPSSSSSCSPTRAISSSILSPDPIQRVPSPEPLGWIGSVSSCSRSTWRPASSGSASSRYTTASTYPRSSRPATACGVARCA